MEHDCVVRFDAAGRQYWGDGVVAVVDMRVAGVQTLKNFSWSLKFFKMLQLVSGLMDHDKGTYEVSVWTLLIKPRSKKLASKKLILI